MPRNIVYNLDYQSEADEEYFNLFSQAGWTHIFSAPSGTKPIYSDRESEIEKYSCFIALSAGDYKKTKKSL